MSSSQDVSNLLHTTNYEVIDSYTEDKTVVRKRIERAAKCISNRFVGLIMCMTKDILKC